MTTAKRLLPIPVLALCLLLPAAAQALPRGFFGIVPQTPVGSRDLARMSSGGVETLRVPVNWSAIQPTARGGFDWSSVDALVAQAAERHIEILPFLCAPPRWVSRNGHRLPVYNGRQRRAWALFAAAAVERYGPRGAFWSEHAPGTAEPLPQLPIHAWQIWNEENFFYFARPVSPGLYARLLAISHRAIRRVDPRATVVTGGLFGNPRQRPPLAMSAWSFLEGLYEDGAKGSFEAVAVHPYARNTAELGRIVEVVRRVMLRHGDRRSHMYVTEMGWGSQNDPRQVAYEVGLHGQARELRRAYGYLIHRRGFLGLRQVDWFSWKDAGGLCNFCDSAGLFRNSRRFRPKPAWHAYVAIAR